MIKKTPKSVTFSQIITIVLFLTALLCLLFAGNILNQYFEYRQMPAKLFIPLLWLWRLGAASGSVTLLILWHLLRRIAQNNFFDTTNVRLLGLLSYCFVWIGVLAGIGMVWYFPCIIIVIAALFVFLILRVLRDLFANATQLKDENDMTI